MAYVLTEEQQFLKDAVRDMMKSSPVSNVRDLRDAHDSDGFSKALWQQMIDMGWPGIASSENLGGLNFGLRSAGVIMEEVGRTLCSSPLLTALVSAQVLEKHGSEEQRSMVNSIGESGKVIAIAIQEGNFYNPSQCQAEVVEEDGKLHVRGTKEFVADGHIADHF